MVNAPVQQTFGCPACGGSFTAHLFVSDLAGEPQKQGRCPWCAHAGTAPTGAVTTAASFCPFEEPTSDAPQLSASELRAWERRLDEQHAWKLIYTEEQRRLTLEGDGTAELRERDEPVYYRGMLQPAPLEVRSWRGRVRPERVRRVADLLVNSPPPEFTLIPDEYPAGANIEHREGSFGVSFMHSVTSRSAQLREAQGMLRVICGDLEGRPATTSVPPTPQNERAPVATVKAVPVVTSKVAPVVTSKAAPIKPAISERVEPPSARIPDDECAVCSARSPFAGRVEKRGRELYAVHRCPSCREDFTVYTPSLQGTLNAWIDEVAIKNGASLKQS